MQISRSKEAIHQFSIKERSKGLSIALVPTMGCLHEGHLSLIKQARSDNDRVIVSIFVNPLQFGANEDLDTYPKTIERDLELLQKLCIDQVFLPDNTEMYGLDHSIKISSGPLGKLYCGETRPQFFDGVLTVVNILFNLTKPHRAYFGEKDLQQAFLIKKMVAELSINTEIISCPIVREADGLAMSSRNNYFSSKARENANIIYKALINAKKLVHNGIIDAQQIIDNTKKMLEAQTQVLKIDYVSLINRTTFLSISNKIDSNSQIIIAVHIKNEPLMAVRLIDNMRLL